MSIIRAAVFTLAFALSSVTAQAAEVVDYTDAGFAAAQASGKPILVDVAAWWCPVCHSQNVTIKQIVASPRYAKLVIFKINYDKQKAEWRKFGVTKQGTLIGFRGKQETSRLAFQTDKTQIAALLASTVR